MGKESFSGCFDKLVKIMIYEYGILLKVKWRVLVNYSN